MIKLFTTPMAAKELGVTRAAVWQLIARGRLKATKIGSDWFIAPGDLNAVRQRRGRGRPTINEVLARRKGVRHG